METCYPKYSVQMHIVKWLFCFFTLVPMIITPANGSKGGSIISIVAAFIVSFHNMIFIISLTISHKLWRVPGPTPPRARGGHSRREGRRRHRGNAFSPQGEVPAEHGRTL